MKFKFRILSPELLLIAGCLAAVIPASGCLTAARKGEQRLEERDGPVGHLLSETRENLRGHPGPTPEQP